MKLTSARLAELSYDKAQPASASVARRNERFAFFVPSFSIVSQVIRYQMFYNGSISERDWNRFLTVWAWGAPRIGGVAAQVQRSFANSHGQLRLVCRINRVRRAIGVKPYDEKEWCRYA